MKIIKFSFSTSLLSCIKWKDHTVLLMNNLFLFVPSGHFFDQVFFNWAPSNLSFALRFFNLFGKTLSHVFSFLSSQKKCFRFESVHTLFERIPLASVVCVLLAVPVSLDVCLWTPAQHLCGFRFHGQHDRMSQEPFQLQRSCLWCPKCPLTNLFIGYLLLAMSNRNKIRLPCWNL